MKNRYILELIPKETRQFLKEFKKANSFSKVSKMLDQLKNLKVLIIGDGIIDEYVFCQSMGRSAKNPIVVHKYLTSESYAGGAFAVANHVAGMAGSVQLVTMLGKTDPKDAFVSSKLKPNISVKYFFRENSQTIVKRRYMDQYLGQKIFEVNYMNDEPIEKNIEKKVIEYLRLHAGGYDIVLVSDFGHGLITEPVKKAIRKYSKKYAVNAQTNAANMGYNLITRYQRPYFVCLDETELRLAVQQKYKDIPSLVKRVRKLIKAGNVFVTLGKNGSVGVGKNGKVNLTPIFSTKVVDTIGAGDAFFAFTSLCLAKGMDVDTVSFIGNVVGAIAVQIMGNKRPIEKQEILDLTKVLLS